MKAEILNMPMHEYVIDNFEGPPSLSSSIARKILRSSPRHGWVSHPRLNPAWAPDDDRKFDVGTAAHAVLLEGRVLKPLDFPDFRSKAARTARDVAKIEGSLPVLAEKAEAITAMVEIARAKIRECPDLVDLGELLPERVLRWQEGDAWCRCRPDWMTYDHAVVLSYKTTDANAEPEAFSRGTLTSMDYDLQAWFESRGVEALTGTLPKYVWLVQETEEPYAVALLGLSPAGAEVAAAKYRAAVTRWSFCMAENRWPSYPDRIVYVDPPQWALAQWLEGHAPALPALVVDDGRPLADQLLGETE